MHRVRMNWTWMSVLVGLALLLGACLPQPAAPTVDVQAAVATAVAQTRVFENAVATSIAATLAASGPPPVSDTDTPTPTVPQTLAAPTPAPTPTPAAQADALNPTPTPVPPAPTPVPPTDTPPPPPPPPTDTPPPPPPTATPTEEKLVIAESDVDGDDGNDFLRGSSNSNNGRVILLPGFQQAEVTAPMVFRDRIVFRVEVFDTRVGLWDGAGIQNVTFQIISDGGGGEVVYERTENNAAYCVFGGGEPDCNVFVFGEHGSRWPDDGEIFTGDYQATIDILAENGESTQWRWGFRIELPSQ